MRFLVAILVGLPLLLPPGMCLCQFVPCATADPNTAESGVIQETSARVAETSGCSCGKHRVKATTSSDNAIGQPCAASNQSSFPVPHEHAPGCPALRSGDQSKIAQSHRLQWDEGTTLIETRNVPNPTTRLAHRTTADFRPIANTPFYLTFLTLLI